VECPAGGDCHRSDAPTERRANFCLRALFEQDACGPNSFRLLLFAEFREELREDLSVVDLSVFMRSGTCATLVIWLGERARDELRDVMFYSSKLLRCPPASLRDTDLYSLLPKAKSEPVYVKSDWERELAVAIKEAKDLRRLKPARFGSIEAGTIVRSKTGLQP
jgi:hypothetical protein